MFTQALRSKHANVASVLEALLTDLGGRFVPKPEERLLAVVHALLHRCYKLPFSNNAEVPCRLPLPVACLCLTPLLAAPEALGFWQRNTAGICGSFYALSSGPVWISQVPKIRHAATCPTPPTNIGAPLQVPESLKKELAGVCKACFNSDTASRHGRIVGQYKRDFQEDLSPAGSHFPRTLGELAGHLKKWKATLQSSVEDLIPPVLRLEDESRNLQVLLHYLCAPSADFAQHNPRRLSSAACVAGHLDNPYNCRPIDSKFLCS